MLALNGEDFEFSMDDLISTCKIIFSSNRDQIDCKIELLGELIKSIIQLYHHENTKKYSTNLLECLDCIHSNNGIQSIISILFNQLNILNNPLIEFFKTITIKLLKIGDLNLNILEFLKCYQIQFDSFKEINIQINNLDFGFTKQSDSYKLDNRFITLNLYLFNVLENLLQQEEEEKVTIKFDNQLVESLLIGLVLLDCDNIQTENLIILSKHYQSFKSNLINIIINQNSSSTSSSFLSSEWWKNIKSKSDKYPIYTIIIGNILSVVRERKESIIQSVLEEFNFTTTNDNNYQLTQVMMEYLIEYKPQLVETKRQELFDTIGQWSGNSMPNDIDSVGIKLSLLSFIVQSDSENPISDKQGDILIETLSTIQQWYLRSKSPLMKDQNVNFSRLDVPLSQFFIVVGQYAVSKNINLSPNQSQLVQSLLVQFVLDQSIVLNYNALKFINIILSGSNNQSLLLPNTSQEFLIDITSKLIEKWIDGSNTINRNSLKRLYNLYSIVISKIDPIIKYKLASNHFTSLLEMLSSNHHNIQKSSYLLLVPYFENKKSEIIQTYVLEQQDQDDIEFIINGTLENLLLNFDNIEKNISIGHLMIWDLLLKNYNEQELNKRPTISSYLNNGRKVATFLTSIFKKVDTETKDFKHDEFPLDNEDMDISVICGYLMYVVVRNLPSMARTWWGDFCSNKVAAQVDQYIVKYISPLLLRREIALVQQHVEPAGSIFNIKASLAKREVVASYEKEDMNISLVLSIPDTYPLRVLSVDFAKRVGVSEMQWKTWLLSMTSLLLTQDGSVLDVSLLWKASLDKHFDGVEVCPICYSLFFNGTIPKFQCKQYGSPLLTSQIVHFVTLQSIKMKGIKVKEKKDINTNSTVVLVFAIVVEARVSIPDLHKLVGFTKQSIASGASFSIQSLTNDSIFEQQQIGGSSSSSASISPQCETDLYDLSKLKYPSSFEIIEASGKGFFDLGNYDNCLSLPSNVSQYCAVTTDNGFVTALAALCLPSSCSETDINMALQTLINMTGMAPYLNETGLGGEFEIYCYSGDHLTDKLPMTAGPIVMIILCSIIAAFVCAGTLAEYFLYTHKALSKKNQDTESYRISSNRNDWERNQSKQEKEHNSSINYSSYQGEMKEASTPLQILLAFSLIQNYHSFTTSSSDKKHFDVLDGIRLLGTCWVVIGHNILFNINFGFDNLQTVLVNIVPSIPFQLIGAAEFSVDIFFMLSGFLVCHTLLQQLEKATYIDGPKYKFWLKYIVHRYIRLSPLYFFMLFFFWKLSPQIGSGPWWFGYYSQTSSCEGSWWSNLLYINTLYPQTGCMGWSWYLGNDMIYYIFVAPIAAVLYKKNKKFGVAFVFILFAITFTTNFWITLKYKLNTVFEITQLQEQVTDFTTDIYQKPWTRVGAYAVGLAMAMIVDTPAIMHVIKNKAPVRYLCYINALGITSFFTFIPYNSYIGDGWSTLQNAFFNATGHTGFVIGAGLFIITAFAGRGGIVAWFLERPIFKNLSKLTYSTYIVHPIVIWTLAYSRVTLFHYAVVDVAATTISNIVFSLVCAFILHLTIEKPAINLEKLLFHPKPSTIKYSLLN
ncbi:RING zinc finger-containing protein [Cavenderia fasciculata]|uniref:RING zinc finger-containing protein n=1 Tax=Cavenderia fasciculata TaxID=261658 RepID=F4Q0D3_CACFS|nr:RING zinc finger-containing protein [Cavenderia fasciculata]EGG18284.1 RING zinc finger-containing protein [Cavenderia fasciculata]|eukprot:XP_004357107.1 RING zinc finger-containing protein [Cavenderia fasciculata]